MMSKRMHAVPRLALVLALLSAPACAEDVTYLEACLGAAGGHTSEARMTCFGQLSEVCLSGSNGTPAEMTLCAELELEAWNGLLDQALMALRANETPERVTAIDAADAAWVVWRDARCGVYTTYDASIAPPLAMLCLAETTSQWVDDLWAIERGLIGEAPL